MYLFASRFADAALLAGAMGEWRLQAEQPGAEWWWWWAEQGEGAGADAGAPDAGATGALGGVVGGGRAEREGCG